MKKNGALESRECKYGRAERQISLHNEWELGNRQRLGRKIKILNNKLMKHLKNKLKNVCGWRRYWFGLRYPHIICHVRQRRIECAPARWRWIEKMAKEKSGRRSPATTTERSRKKIERTNANGTIMRFGIVFAFFAAATHNGKR